ncbi:unnamed protein product [Rotaria socialis]|uniref:Uncharacterized protein n=1 Tax=Rotaria socialis TaxID=392032 RepID=A0A821PIC4_9BILA|nr:unnamed protein product [Rotaria socialis]
MNVQSTMWCTTEKSTQTDDINVKKQGTATIILPLEYYERMPYAYYATLYNQSTQANNANTIGNETSKTATTTTTTTIGFESTATGEKSTGHSLETKSRFATDMNIEQVDLQSILASNILELSTFSPIVDQNDDTIVMTPPIVDSSDEAIEKSSAQTTTTPNLPRKSKPKSLGKRKTECLRSELSACDVESVVHDCAVPPVKLYRSQFKNPIRPLAHLGKIPKKK